jgi:hypothetical protein
LSTSGSIRFSVDSMGSILFSRLPRLCGPLVLGDEEVDLALHDADATRHRG